MADNSKIEWCDASWNPIRSRAKEDMVIRGREVPAGKWGYHCERISPGCVNCYASTMNGRMLPAWGTGLDYTVPNRDKVEIFIDEQELLKPLKWKKPRRIFPCSMTDWCADFVTDEMRDRMLAVAVGLSQHTFLFLTKRADRCAEYFARRPLMMRYPAGNILIGFSAEDQPRFDERWSHMRKIEAAGWKVWCSAEPLLGPINLGDGSPLSWLVVGGESGHGARPMDLAWVRDIVQQCKTAGVSCFVKQIGAFPVAVDTRVPNLERWRIVLKDRKGGDMSEWSEDLRVREFPGAR